MNWLRRLFAAESGSILVLAALSLSALMGMSGIAVELGNGYAAKVRDQRVADMAALGAAAAFANSGQSIAATRAVAADIVNANGLAAPKATVQVVAPIVVGGNQAIQVQITTSVPIKLASFLASAASYNVTASATATLPQPNVVNTAQSCITALGAGSTAISASGGAAISATGCSLSTNGTIYSSNGSAKITASAITAQAINDTAAAYHQNAVTLNDGSSSSFTLMSGGASDFLKSNTNVQQALCYVNKLTGYSDPDYPGGNTNCTTQLVLPATPASVNAADWNLGYQPKSAGGVYAYQKTDYSCDYVIPDGNYTIGKLTVGGGCKITFGKGTLKFSSIDMSGSAMVIGDGAVTVAGTFSVNGGDNNANPVTLGDGDHSFGSLAITGGKALKLGSGNLNITGGVSVSGGAWLKANVSTGETVTIGNTSGTAINIGSGSQVCFTSDCGSPTAAAGTFSANGTITNGGGSTIVFPNSAMHVINGDLTLAGAATLGSGLYIVKGNWTNGTGCSSCVMSGVDITVALGGTFNFGGGTKFDLAAPTASSTYGITDVLIVTKSTSATSINAGSNGKASGVIYAPNSAFSSSGGTAISSKGSACMMLLVNTIAVSGSGTINTANCTSQNSTSTSTSGGTAKLVQ